MSAARYARSLARFAAEGDDPKADTYECPVCGYTFDSQSALEEHLSSEHAKAGGPHIALQYDGSNGVLFIDGQQVHSFTVGFAHTRDGEKIPVYTTSGNTATLERRAGRDFEFSMARAIPCTFPGCKLSFRTRLGLKIHGTLMGHQIPADTYEKGDGPVAEPRVHRGPRTPSEPAEEPVVEEV